MPNINYTVHILYKILDTYGAHAEILFANHLAFGIHKLIKYQNIRVFHLKTFMCQRCEGKSSKSEQYFRIKGMVPGKLHYLMPLRSGYFRK